ncbi:MAG: DUF4836 family protein [Chitinophagaceae bacterium]|nr:MAG: DUF4836 family protein [Chitinophagaceae bacterium]
MKRNTLLLAIAVTVTLFAVSCKKGGKTGLLVPKEAAVVFYFNSGSLSSKLSWEEIKKSEWFQQASREASDSFARKMLQDPSLSGVNTEKGFCFFLAGRGRGGYASFQGDIKDQAAFEEMVKHSEKSSATPEKSGDLTILRMNDAVLTWNKSKFVFVADAPFSMNMNGSKRFPEDSLVEFAKNIYKLKGKDLLDSDSKFADLIQSKGDMHLWLNAGNLYSNMTMGIMDMMKMNVLMEGNISTGTLSFDDGKITLNGKQYYGKELTKLINKYSSKGAGSELTGRLPNGDVLAAGVYSYPVGAITEMIKLIGADGLANAFLGQKGLSLDDIGKAFKGDLAFAVTDVVSRVDTVKYEYEGKTSSYTTNKSEPQYVFGMAIDDQKSFDKIYNVFSEDLNKMPSGMADIKTEKGWLTVSNTPALTSGFLAGNNKPAYADKISGHTLGVFFNLQKFMSLIDSEMRDSASSKVLQLSKETWQDVTMYADYKGGTGSYQFDVNLINKGTNSLKQLNQYADKIVAIRNAERARYNVVDSTTATEEPPKAFN